jgi:hypothetical protein
MIRIEQVSIEQITRLRSSLQAGGSQVEAEQDGKTFHIKGHGVEAQAVYDAAVGLPTVTIIHKPLVTEHYIEMQLRKALSGAATIALSGDRDAGTISG